MSLSAGLLWGSHGFMGHASSSPSPRKSSPWTVGRRVTHTVSQFMRNVLEAIGEFSLHGESPADFAHDLPTYDTLLITYMPYIHILINRCNGSAERSSQASWALSFLSPYSRRTVQEAIQSRSEVSSETQRENCATNFSISHFSQLLRSHPKFRVNCSAMRGPPNFEKKCANFSPGPRCPCVLRQYRRVPIVSSRTRNLSGHRRRPIA